jgi:hypothetical protein
MVRAELKANGDAEEHGNKMVSEKSPETLQSSYLKDYSYNMEQCVSDSSRSSSPGEMTSEKEGHGEEPYDDPLFWLHGLFNNTEGINTSDSS